MRSVLISPGGSHKSEGLNTEMSQACMLVGGKRETMVMTSLLFGRRVWEGWKVAEACILFDTETGHQASTKRASGVFSSSSELLSVPD